MKSLRPDPKYAISAPADSSGDARNRQASRIALQLASKRFFAELRGALEIQTSLDVRPGA
jgi:hypothetical protein